MYLNVFFGVRNNLSKFPTSKYKVLLTIAVRIASFGLYILDLTSMLKCLSSDVKFPGSTSSATTTENYDSVTEDQLSVDEDTS